MIDLNTMNQYFYKITGKRHNPHKMNASDKIKNDESLKN